MGSIEGSYYDGQWHWRNSGIFTIIDVIRENNRKNKEIEEMRNKIKFLSEENKANKKDIEENKQIVKTFDVMKNEIKILIDKDKKNKIEIEEMKKLVKFLTEENDNNKKEVEENKKYLALIEKNMSY